MLKPIAAALVLPPVPWLLLVAWGAWKMPARRGAGWAAIAAGLLGLWLSACQGTAIWVQDALLRPGPPMTGERLDRLTQRQRAGVLGGSVSHGATGPVAIIVLGAGRDVMAKEYGMADLSVGSAERLRYGIWLSRRTGIPLGFSGGVGWAQKGREAGPADIGASEAEVGARVARDQYGWPLKWVEGESADTRENAARTVAMLVAQGVEEVVIVTHAFHVRRARRAFEDEAARLARPGARPIEVSAAPMAYWGGGERTLLQWLPSAEGLHNVHKALRECVGLLAGA